MGIDKAKLLQAKLDGIRATLERATEKQKKDLVSIAMAEDFNRIVADVAEAYPELKGSLPQEIKPHRMARDLGMSEVNYLELEIYLEQVLRLLNAVA